MSPAAQFYIYLNTALRNLPDTAANSKYADATRDVLDLLWKYELTHSERVQLLMEGSFPASGTPKDTSPE